MSLTSYRAAPPRGSCPKAGALGTPLACPDAGVGRCGVWLVKRGSGLGGPGDDLLSRVLRRSTIGAEAFNGRVRNGIGFGHPAMITRSAKNREGAPGGPEGPRHDGGLLMSRGVFPSGPPT